MSNIGAKVLVPGAVLSPPAADWAAAIAVPVFKVLQWVMQGLVRRSAVRPLPAAAVPARSA